MMNYNSADKESTKYRHIGIRKELLRKKRGVVSPYDKLLIREA